MKFPDDRILACLPDTVLRCTGDGVVTACHRGQTDVGFVDGDVVGLCLSALLPVSAAQIMLAAVQQTALHVRSQSAVYALDPGGVASGERRYFEVRAVPERNAHVVCIIRDITDQRVAEQGLIRRDLYLGALTQFYHRLLTAAAQDDAVSSDTLAMLGYAAGANLAYYVDLTRTSLDGKLPIDSLVWQSDQLMSRVASVDLAAHLRRRPVARWLPMLKGGRPVQDVITEAAGSSPDGTSGPVVCLILPIVVQGRLVGMLGLESYVRLRQWPDDEVDYLRAAVAAVVLHAERAQVTAQLETSAEEIVRMNVQLAEARDLARASDRAKSEFLGVMGHEIRTPLNPIIAMSEMLLDTGLTSEQRDYAELVHAAANRLLTQINAILAYTEAETLKLANVPFDLVETVEKVADLFKPLAHERHLSLMTFCHPDLPLQLLGDPLRLSAVLGNLLDNALKFTKDGEVIVRVEPVLSKSSIDTGVVSLRFSVSDTGVGLPVGASSWLFQPFTQADGTTTRQYGGTGLGLATAKRWVDAMGGRIGVRGNPGGGTVFWYSVPCNVAANTVMGWGSDEFWREQTLEGLRVLVVDDLAGNREILKRYLELWRATCDAVMDGQQALAALSQAQRPYHVVLIDLMLPGMNGIALAAAIQQQMSVEDTRLVLVTAHDAPGLEERIRRAGISGYLTKPFHRDKLYSALVHAMAMVDIPGDPSDDFAVEKLTSVIPEISLTTGPDVAAESVDGTPTVLVIERNPILRRVAAKDIAAAGCDVLPVATQAEALRAVSDRHVDLVVFDLPKEHSGLVEFTEALQAASVCDGRRYRVMMVGMMAQPGIDTPSRCDEAGLEACVAKPLTPTIVRRLLSQWRAGRS